MSDVFEEKMWLPPLPSTALYCLGRLHLFMFHCFLCCPNTCLKQEQVSSFPEFLPGGKGAVREKLGQQGGTWFFKLGRVELLEFSMVSCESPLPLASVFLSGGKEGRWRSFWAWILSRCGPRLGCCAQHLLLALGSELCSWRIMSLGSVTADPCTPRSVCWYRCIGDMWHHLMGLDIKAWSPHSFGWSHTT